MHVAQAIVATLISAYKNEQLLMLVATDYCTVNAINHSFPTNGLTQKLQLFVSLDSTMKAPIRV